MRPPKLTFLTSRSQRPRRYFGAGTLLPTVIIDSLGSDAFSFQPLQWKSCIFYVTIFIYGTNLIPFICLTLNSK